VHIFVVVVAVQMEHMIAKLDEVPGIRRFVSDHSHSFVHSTH